MSSEFVPLNGHERALVGDMLRTIHRIADPTSVAMGGAWYSKILDKVHKAKDNTLHLVKHNLGKVVESIPFYTRISGAIEGHREAFRPQDRKLLERIGANRIVDVKVCRKPVFDWIHTALGVLSRGKWGELMKKYGFDRFFHLFVIITLDNGVRVKVEKNEVITFTLDPKLDGATEFMDVGAPPIATPLMTWLNNTYQLMGSRFFPYDSLGGNNCQDFVKSMLAANGMWTESARSFVYQDISELSRELDSFTKRAAKGITDLAARANIIVHGKGFSGGGDGDFKDGLGYKLFKWLFSAVGSRLVKGAEDRAAARAKGRGGGLAYDLTIGRAMNQINNSISGFSHILDSFKHA